MATGRIPDPNTAPLTAKGDLYTYSTVPARLAVGSDGDTLVADSAATTGLRWNINQTAGKNAIINGDFRINQRSFSSTTTNGTYGFDRWRIGAGDGTVTYSAQTFTPGAAPVAGYEGINFARIVTTGQTATNANALLNQRIEDARTFAGQVVTFSFWAKAASGTPKVAVEIAQIFGTTGSPSANVNTYFGQVTLSTSWARYSVTGTVPSVSGKTFGTDANSSYLQASLWVSAGTTYDARTGSLGIQSNTFDFWGVQVEAGSVATAFQTATGTIQGELAACQRYYYRQTTIATNRYLSVQGNAISTTVCRIPMVLPVTMRTTPTSVDYGGSLNLDDGVNAGIAITSLGLVYNTAFIGGLTASVASGLTQYRPYSVFGTVSGDYVGWSAEL